MSRIVAIVGRPNVGKSTLFNRLTGERKAIVDQQAGVTRDRHYGKCEWNGVEFSLIDTGGYVTNSDDVFEEQIRRQVKLALDEADLVLFLTDVKNGITDLDDAIAQILRRSEKKVILAVNKVDNHERLYDANEFYALGLGDYFPVSSINGSGTGDLLDAVTNSFPEHDPAPDEEETPKYAIIGRPNVGKSSFVNALLGQERNIVTPVSGTTRDAIYTRYKKYNHDFYLIDTAGLRKKTKVSQDVEFYSVMRSVRAIEAADVCFLLIDAVQGIEAQDVNIFRLVQRNRKGIVILVNKWDLVEKETSSTKKYTEKLHERFAPFVDLPIVFISALTKQRIHKALELGLEVSQNRAQRIKTSVLNDLLLPEIKAKHPPAVKGRQISIKYVRQLPSKSPAFAFYCNYPQYIKDPYKRYLENRLRSHFNFTGVPIQIFFRKK